MLESLFLLHITIGAIKFGDLLSVNACQGLMAQLAGCELPFQCAHGRPTIIPLLQLNALIFEKAGIYSYFT